MTGRSIFTKWALTAVILLAQGFAAPVQAAAPVVTNNSAILATGARKYIYLQSSTSWTGVLTNLKYTILDKPKNGTLTQPGLSSGYSYYCLYSADRPGYVGADSFTWCASSGTQTSNVSTCSITIVTNSVPAGRAFSTTTKAGTPVAVSLTAYTTHASQDYGQTITYAASQAEHGEVKISSSYAIYSPAGGFVGTDSFTWTVSDGIAVSAPVTATVTVLPGPPVASNQTAVVVKNNPTIIHPLFKGGEGMSLKFLKVSGTSRATLTADGSAFRYAPASNFVGNDIFRWQIAYSNETTPYSTTAVAICSIVVRDASTNSNWSQWRFDECRLAQSSAILPDTLRLQWRRDVPMCAGGFSKSSVDKAPVDIDNCRPVQFGKTLFVPLLANDSVTAYDTDTGAQKWRYYTSGALRRPPAALPLANGTNAVIFGCDDGYVYCLNAANGSEIWKFRAAPNAEKAMGFGRMSSVWPLWASPLTYSNKVYFVAGRISTYGLFGYCLDAATGNVIWKNDGRMLGDGGNSTFGPLSFSSDHKKIYGTKDGRGYWIIDPANGELLNGMAGFRNRWFVDGSGNNQDAEPMQIAAGGWSFTPETVSAIGVKGQVHSMCAGDGKLFVVSRSGDSGSIYCFGGGQGSPSIYANEVIPLPAVAGWTSAVRSMLSREDLKQGLALVWGVGSGRLVEELARQSTNLMIVAADPDAAKLRALRIKMDAAGLSGARVSTVCGNPMECGFAPYQAALIASENVGVAGFADGRGMVKMLYDCTRPFGGEIWLPTMSAQHAAIAGWVDPTNMPLCETARQTGFAGIEGFTQIKRTGFPDARVALKAPFRLTAFGESWTALAFTKPTKGTTSGHNFHHYGPSIMDEGYVASRDIYSWLPVSAAMPGYEPQPTSNNVAVRVPDTGPNIGATIFNPLFARVEKAPKIIWSAGCNGNTRYGDFFMGFGKILYLGQADTSPYIGITTFPEIGGCCTPFGIAANGTAAFAPMGIGLCNSRSMVFTQVGLTPAPDEENWMSYRRSLSIEPVQEKPVKRIGVNFGAPGDRYVEEEQMFWTHHPCTARATEERPLIPVEYRGSVKNVYHHSAQMYGAGRATRYRGWVSASQVTGMDGLTIHLASPLVALRTTTPPAIDGRLTDGCWDKRGLVNIPSKKTGCTDACYVMLRYDDANLYVGGGVRGTVNGDLQVELNGRDRQLPSLNFKTAAIYTNAVEGYSAEIRIPWATLEAAGIWKEQLIMNAKVDGEFLAGEVLNASFTPVYLDAVRGEAARMKPHTVRLYFAEMEDRAPGQRVFDVKMQGQTVLTGLDVAAQAGSLRWELVKEFQNVQIADKLDIDFVRKSGEPMLSGIEVIGTYGVPTNALPVAVLDASVLSGPAPLEVTFSARRSFDPDGQIVECAWETGDGRLAKGASVRHVFAEPGTYRVNLLVMDSRGDTAVANVVVTVGAGVPAAFVCKIRASGGDFTDLVKWESATEGDLTSKSVLFQVSSTGNYANTDNGQPVTFSGGATGTLRWLTTNQAPVIAAVSGIGGTGTVSVGTVTTKSGHTFIISDTGTAVRSLLFAVSGRGTYTPATDNGKKVTFSGGGSGTLKHINTGSIAYIAECRGTIQAGTVTCASGDVFTIADAGNPIITAVAECYNDWTNGLKGTVKVSGWITDENHAVTIRTAAGQGHKGKLRDSTGKFTGFGMASGVGIDMAGTPYSRVERVALDGGALTLGPAGSANRICGNIKLSGTAMMVANSVVGTFDVILAPSDVAVYNCTAQTFKLGYCTNLRLINCLTAPGGTGFSDGDRPYSRSHCISGDGTATNFFVSAEALDGNVANQNVVFADVSKKDYHLSITDTGARGMGVAGLGADIDGDERSGPAYDVGADQTFGNHAPRIEGGVLATPAAVGTGTVVRFTVAASDYEGDPLVFSWAFGDGNGTYGTNVTYVYTATGVYTARVTVSDGALSVTGSVAVTVLDMFDAWLVEHFGATNAPTGGVSDDPDHDGMSNAQEFLAGTDPLNAGSVLALTDIKPETAEGKVVLQWSSESNRWYWIGRSTNLMTGFEPIISHIPATYPLNTCTVDVGAAEDGFFVIRLE